MSDTMTSLTTHESERLRICTEIILAGLRGDFDAGIALNEVKGSKLYRGKWPTFEAYCLDVFQISRARAYQLIEATEIKESLPAVESKLIVNESQARALAKVPEDQRASVIKEASKTGPITAANLVETAAQMSKIVDMPEPIKSGKSVKAPLVFDEDGCAIPVKIQPLWNRAKSEAKEAMSLISKVRSAVRDAEQEQDIIFSEVKLQAFVHDLSAIYSTWKLVLPYGVCTTCNGHPDTQPKSQCTGCRGRGFVSEHAYKTFGDDRVKKIRAKSKEV